MMENASGLLVIYTRIVLMELMSRQLHAATVGKLNSKGHVHRSALGIFSNATMVKNAYLPIGNVTDQMIVLMEVMNRQIPVERTAGELTSNALMENASGLLVNAMGSVTALMEATRLLMDVYKAALGISSNVTMVNAYLPKGYVTDTLIVLMGVMNR